jgi:hypothetical protein
LSVQAVLEDMVMTGLENAVQRTAGNGEFMSSMNGGTSSYSVTVTSVLVQAHVPDIPPTSRSPHAGDAVSASATDSSTTRHLPSKHLRMSGLLLGTVPTSRSPVIYYCSTGVPAPGDIPCGRRQRIQHRTSHLRNSMIVVAPNLKLTLSLGMARDRRAQSFAPGPHCAFYFP